MIQYGISGYDARTGLTGILPYLFQRKVEAYSMIETLKDHGGDRLKVIEFTWEELNRTPEENQSKEVSELYKRINEELDKLEGK